jgi:integrase
VRAHLHRAPLRDARDRRVLARRSDALHERGLVDVGEAHLLHGVEVIEIAPVFLEAVRRRQRRGVIAQVVLAELAGGVAEIEQELGTGDGLKGLRDRALLLIGFAGAFRRSELVALDCEDIEQCETGIKITIRHSKTDQEGQGATIAIVRGSIACPVAALQTWQEAVGITTGALFRSIRKGGKVGARLTDQSVSDIVKTHVERVGLDPSLFAGHSLRAGFLTSVAKRGASIFKMMDVSRHRSVDTLRGYVRDAEIFKDHAGAGLL